MTFVTNTTIDISHMYDDLLFEVLSFGDLHGLYRVLFVNKRFKRCADRVFARIDLTDIIARIDTDERMHIFARKYGSPSMMVCTKYGAEMISKVHGYILAVVEDANNKQHTILTTQFETGLVPSNDPMKWISRCTMYFVDDNIGEQIDLRKSCCTYYEKYDYVRGTELITKDNTLSTSLIGHIVYRPSKEMMDRMREMCINFSISYNLLPPDYMCTQTHMLDIRVPKHTVCYKILRVVKIE